MLRRLCGALAVGAVAFGFLSCGTDDSPGAAPSTVSADPPSDSPTSPTSVETNTSLTPVQIVRAWVENYNTLLAGGDRGELDELTAVDCTTCDSLIDTVASTWADGGAYRGGQWAIEGAGVSSRRGDVVIVAAGIAIAAGSVRLERGGRFQDYPAEKQGFQFRVDTSTDPHQVTGVAIP